MRRSGHQAWQEAAVRACVTAVLLVVAAAECAHGQHLLRPADLTSALDNTIAIGLRRQSWIPQRRRVDLTSSFAASGRADEFCVSPAPLPSRTALSSATTASTTTTPTGTGDVPSTVAATSSAINASSTAAPPSTLSPSQQAAALDLAAVANAAEFAASLIAPSFAWLVMPQDAYVVALRVQVARGVSAPVSACGDKLPALDVMRTSAAPPTPFLSCRGMHSVALACRANSTLRFTLVAVTQDAYLGDGASDVTLSMNRWLEAGSECAIGLAEDVFRFLETFLELTPAAASGGTAAASTLPTAAVTPACFRASAFLAFQMPSTISALVPSANRLPTIAAGGEATAFWLGPSPLYTLNALSRQYERKVPSGVGGGASFVYVASVALATNVTQACSGLSLAQRYLLEPSDANSTVGRNRWTDSVKNDVAAMGTSGNCSLIQIRDAEANVSAGGNGSTSSLRSWYAFSLSVVVPSGPAVVVVKPFAFAVLRTSRLYAAATDAIAEPSLADVAGQCGALPAANRAVEGGRLPALEFASAIAEHLSISGVVQPPLLLDSSTAPWPTAVPAGVAFRFAVVDPVTGAPRDMDIPLPRGTAAATITTRRRVVVCDVSSMHSAPTAAETLPISSPPVGGVVYSMSFVPMCPTLTDIAVCTARSDACRFAVGGGGLGSCCWRNAPVSKTPQSGGSTAPCNFCRAASSLSLDAATATSAQLLPQLDVACRLGASHLALRNLLFVTCKTYAGLSPEQCVDDHFSCLQWDAVQLLDQRLGQYCRQTRQCLDPGQECITRSSFADTTTPPLGLNHSVVEMVPITLTATIAAEGIRQGTAILKLSLDSPRFPWREDITASEFAALVESPPALQYGAATLSRHVFQKNVTVSGNGTFLSVPLGPAPVYSPRWEETWTLSDLRSLVTLPAGFSMRLHNPVVVRVVDVPPSKSLRRAGTVSVALAVVSGALGGPAAWIGVASTQTMLFMSAVPCGSPSVSEVFGDVLFLASPFTLAAGDSMDQVDVFFATWGVIVGALVLHGGVAFSHWIMTDSMSLRYSASQTGFPSLFLYSFSVLYVSLVEIGVSQVASSRQAVVRIFVFIFLAILLLCTGWLWLRYIRGATEMFFEPLPRPDVASATNGDGSRQPVSSVPAPRLSTFSETVAWFFRPTGWWPHGRCLTCVRGLSRKGAVYSTFIALIGFAVAAANASDYGESNAICRTTFTNGAIGQTVMLIAALALRPFRVPALNFFWCLARFLEIVAHSLNASWAFNTQGLPNYFAESNVAHLFVVGYVVQTTFNVVAAVTAMRDVMREPPSEEQLTALGTHSAGIAIGLLRGHTEIPGSTEAAAPQPPLFASLKAEETALDDTIASLVAKRDAAWELNGSGTNPLLSAVPFGFDDAARRANDDVPDPPEMRLLAEDPKLPLGAGLATRPHVIRLGPLPEGFSASNVLFAVGALGAVSVDVVSGYAFVTMRNWHAAHAAQAAMHGRLLFGHRVECEVVGSDASLL